MSYLDDCQLKELSNQIREFAKSINMIGTSCQVIHEEAETIIRTVRELANRHGGNV